MPEEMTITRGLAELKLLDQRINKQIDNARFVDVYQNRNKKAANSNDTIENFTKNTLASYDSIKSLIKRRNDIKSAITTSNAETKVKINGEEMTVAESIDRKSSISYQKKLLDKMRSEYVSVNTRVQTARTQLDNQVQSLLEQNLGADKKADKEAFDNIAKPLIEANEWHMIDPINIPKEIEKLDESIDKFMSEIDFVLSESNAKTTIKV